MSEHRIFRYLKHLMPVLMTAFLFLILIYQFILPSLQSAVLNKHKDSAKIMSQSVQSILTHMEERVLRGELSRDDAQTAAAGIINALRYGDDGNGYFWIISSRPDMLVHPYFPDLKDRYMGEIEDSRGKLYFKEMVKIAEERGAGYITYQRQKLDDQEIIIPKTSYITLFSPWDWIIGTGIFLENTELEIRSFNRRLNLFTILILPAVILLMTYASLRAGKKEKEIRLSLEEQLGRSKMLQAVFDHTNQMTAILSPEGTLLRVSSKFLDLTGLKEGDITGKKIWQIPMGSPESRDRIRTAVQKAGREESDPVEISRLRGDRDILMSFSFTPVPDEQGKVLYILSEGYDRGELKASRENLESLNKDIRIQRENHREKIKSLQEKLEKTQQHLIQSEKMAALGRLVAGVTHEINTPLGISVTAASSLEERTQQIQKIIREDNLTEEDFSNYLETAVESSGMILANLEKASSHIKVFKQVAVDQSDEGIRSIILKDYLQEIVKSLHTELKKKPCLIDISCPEELEITTFPGTLSRILSNLIINSLIHGFRELDSGTITIGCRLEKNRLIINYQDNGRGLDDAENRIFDPFDTTASYRGGGRSRSSYHL